MIDVEDLIQTFRQRWQARDVESNGFALVFGKKMLSEVGFEPTLSYEDQNSLCSPLSRGQGNHLESGALDHSAILTELFRCVKYSTTFARTLNTPKVDQVTARKSMKCPNCLWFTLPKIS